MRPIPSRPASILLLALLSGGCGGGGASDPVVLYVTALDDSGPGTLRQVVADAPEGATIRIDPSLGAGTALLLSPILVTKPLTIDGSVPGGHVTLDGAASTRHFTIEGTSGVHLVELTLVGGRSWTEGGSVRAEDAAFTLDRVQIVDGEADSFGGGVFALRCDVTMTTCHVYGCTARYGGGVFFARAPSRILHCSVIANSAIDGGGGGLALVGGDHVLRNTTVIGNGAAGGGPGFDVGGGVAAVGSGTDGPLRLRVCGCTIAGNSAAQGGGIFLDEDVLDARLDCRQSVVAGNFAPTGPDLGAGATVEVAGAWNVVGNLAGGPIWNGIDGNVVGDPVTPVDPLLGPAVPGPTGTFFAPLLAGSPALDLVPHDESLDEAGRPLLLDQVFASRTEDAAADAGAVEAHP